MSHPHSYRDIYKFVTCLDHHNHDYNHENFHKISFISSLTLCEMGHQHSSHRADSRFASSQWETALLCNDVSHWLGANLVSALYHTYLKSYRSIHCFIKTHWIKLPVADWRIGFHFEWWSTTNGSSSGEQELHNKLLSSWGITANNKWQHDYWGLHKNTQPHS